MLLFFHKAKFNNEVVSLVTSLQSCITLFKLDKLKRDLEINSLHSIGTFNSKSC